MSFLQKIFKRQREVSLPLELYVTIESVLERVAHYQRWHREGTAPEPCDFCFNTTEHMGSCPVLLAQQALKQLGERR